MANNENIALGPAEVTFSGTIGGVVYDNFDLGVATDDGVTITFTNDVVEIATDRTGTQPAKIFSSGQGATVTTPLLEEVFDTFYIAQVGAVSGTGNRTDFGRQAGYDQTNNWSGRLIVRPIDTTRDQYEFYKATPTGEKSLTHNSNGATVLNVEWRCLPDSTLEDGKQLGYKRAQS